MARLVLCALALILVGCYASPVQDGPPKVADKIFLKRQSQLLILFHHIHEPLEDPELMTLASTWDIQENVAHFNNATAVKRYMKLFPEYLLPRGMPFNVHDSIHLYEAKTMFYMLHSAKDYDTFFNTAVHLRDHVNEDLFVYVLSLAVLHRHDTHGLKLPPIYEILPSHMINGQVLSIADYARTHRKLGHPPGTYMWDNNVVVRWNDTLWPYVSKHYVMSYYTNDPALNAFYYNLHLMYPKWLGGEIVPLNKEGRGQFFWFLHKQFMTRYYMERLSNGQSEIPVLGRGVVEDGYQPDIRYFNGVSYPSRPFDFNLDQPQFTRLNVKIQDAERRIRDAVDNGYFLNGKGEYVSLRHKEDLDVLGNIIESNVDSPNRHFYQDFISIWKAILGNSVKPTYDFRHEKPLLLPAPLEHYQSAMRDPAFYMIMKRVLHFFEMWFDHLPYYTHEELALPSVVIEKVEHDKLSTHFEHAYLNISSFPSLEHEHAPVEPHGSVLVEYPRLNHKPFEIRVHVKSEVSQKVVVTFFLAPKYDSLGYEIPLQQNTQNFYLLDKFLYELPAGEHIIRRDSKDNMFTSEKWLTGAQIYQKVQKALHEDAEYVVDSLENIEGFPDHLLLPKGHLNGMPCVLMVYIHAHEEHTHEAGQTDPFHRIYGAPVEYAIFNPHRSLGFPVDRPLYYWQIEGVHNLHLQDVMVHHKLTPEISVPHNY